MTTLYDGDALRASLLKRQTNLIDLANAQRNDPEQEIAVHRLDAAAENTGAILKELDLFLVSTARKPMEDIEVETKQLVRTHARGTSWEAALSITPEKRQRMYKLIYLFLSKIGPMTDHELRDAMKARKLDVSWSGVSVRRNELEKAGWVRATDEKRETEFGGRAIVWEAVPEEP